MPTVSIPEAFRPSVSRIADLSEAEFQDVKQSLGALKPHVKPDAMMQQASGAKTAVSGLPDILQVVLNLSIGRLKSEIPLNEFASGIVKSLKLQPSDAAILEKRLQELLDLESILRSARAYDVQHEYEKVLTRTRIVTDIRPVFNAAGTEALDAMIVHNLSIGYFEDSEYKETVYAMDDVDILRLKKVLERAETKSAVLMRIIEKAGIGYFESK